VRWADLSRPSATLPYEGRAWATNAAKGDGGLWLPSLLGEGLGERAGEGASNLTPNALRRVSYEARRIDDNDSSAGDAGDGG
jgi:hypothetical protein